MPSHLGAVRQLATVEAGLREADESDDDRIVLTALVQRRRALLRSLKLTKLGALVGPPARFLRQQLELLRMAHVLADAVVEATIALLAGRYDELRAAPGFDSLQRILPPLIYLRLLRAVPPAALDAAARGDPPRPWPRLADDRVTGSFAAPSSHQRRGRASPKEEEEVPHEKRWRSSSSTLATARGRGGGGAPPGGARRPETATVDRWRRAVAVGKGDARGSRRVAGGGIHSSVTL